MGRLQLEDFINSAEERWQLRLLLLLFDPWGPARRVCFARGGAPGSAGCHCSGIEQVVEENLAAEAVQVMVREVRHTLVILTTRKKATAE